MSKGMNHRFSVAVIATALMFVWTGVNAMWARLSDAQLVETSSMIVVGTFAKTATVSSDGRTQTVGVIEIDTVLKGDLGTKTIWLNVPQPGTPISSSDIFYRIGQKGLWFLRSLEPKSAAIFAADHPQRFVPFANAGPRIEDVRKLLKR